MHRKMLVVAERRLWCLSNAELVNKTVHGKEERLKRGNIYKTKRNTRFLYNDSGWEKSEL